MEKRIGIKFRMVTPAGELKVAGDNPGPRSKLPFKFTRQFFHDIGEKIAENNVGGGDVFFPEVFIAYCYTGDEKIPQPRHGKSQGIDLVA
jgi:hypothetical protein